MKKYSKTLFLFPDVLSIIAMFQVQIQITLLEFPSFDNKQILKRVLEGAYMRLLLLG